MNLKMFKKSIMFPSTGDSDTLKKKYGKLKCLLGKGGSSKCWLLEYNNEDNKSIKIAVKDFKKPCNKRMIMNEFTIGSVLHHENIIETLDIIIEKKHSYEILELCKTDLFEWIKSGLDEFNKERLFGELLNGISYLHVTGVCHRDLKPENCLIDFENHLKITDFGCAKVIKNPFSSNIELCNERCGSFPYMPPEVLDTDEKYDGMAVDIWACGIIYIVLITEKFAWLKATMKDDKYKNYVKKMRIDGVKDFIVSVLDPEPAKRWKIQDLIDYRAKIISNKTATIEKTE